MEYTDNPYPLADEAEDYLTEALAMIREAKKLLQSPSQLTRSESARVVQLSKDAYQKIDDAGTAANALWGAVT